MDDRIFRKICDIVYQQSGITLNDSKVALVESRIGKRIRQLRMDNYEQYLAYLEGPDFSRELVNLLDAISTNVTSFFREYEHFEILDELLRNMVKNGQKRIRMWSAASSSGEEPYSIAMTALNATSGSGVDFKLLATDISTKMLAMAREAVYPADKVEPVPQEFKARYLKREISSRGDVFRVLPEVTGVVSLARVNLAEPPFPMKGPMDAVFVRNVMIYFDNAVKQRLLTDMIRLLKPGGHLFIGHTESLSSMTLPLKLVCPSVYVKK